MAEKIFLITDAELAQHTNEKQLQVVAALQQIHAAHPEIDGASLINAAYQLVSAQNSSTEEWNYSTGSSFDPVSTILPEFDDEQIDEWLHNDVVPRYEAALEETPVVEEEPTSYEEYNVEAEEPSYEEVVETPAEEVAYEPQPLPPVPSEHASVENVIEDDDDVEENKDGENHDEDYFANPTTVSRQRKWRGLLSEAGKLDR